ncbi:MAG: hypothetical protein V1645_04735 [archaeon]
MQDNVLALAVTPSQVDFTNYGKSSIVVFNTEDYVKDFSVQSTYDGFSVDKNSLRIPPRSKDIINVTSSCNDCEAKLYIRELSNSNGIKIEPAVIVKLSSGEPEESDSEFDIYQGNDVTSFSFLDLKKPEILAFTIISSLLLVSAAFFFGRKFYIKKFIKKSNARKKKWLKKLF